MTRNGCQESFISQSNCSNYYTYGSELWCIKASERQKLNVFERKFLRSMACVSRLDRFGKKLVRKDLAAKVDMHVLRWFGHVTRINNG